MANKAATSKLDQLTPFVGRWETSGEMKVSVSGNSPKFTATDTYEWLPGGHFLLHRFDADMPDGKTQGIEIIGHNPESDSYFMHSFDSGGNESVMHARLDNENWAFVGELICFNGTFRDSETFAGLWESRESTDKPWQPLMDVTLKRVG